MKKQPEITEATRRSIMDAFWELYKESSMEKITVNAVGTKANIHRSTFYRYFVDINDVLNQVEEELLTRLREDVLMTFSEMVHSDMQAQMETISQLLKPHAEKIYYLTGSQGDPTFKDKLRELFRPFFMMHGMMSGESLEQDYVFTVMFTMMQTNLNYWYGHQDSCTLQEVLAMSKKLIGKGAAVLGE